jgi:hypothetical protein
MRDTFYEYYPPTPEEFTKLWQEATFVLDTGLLLNIYRYGAETRELFFKILEKLSDHLWIPYQVGREYQDNRLDVIADQIKYYDDLSGALEGARRLHGAMNKRRHHAFADPHLMDSVESAIMAAMQEVDKEKSAHPEYYKYYTDDPLREKLTDLLKGKVGAPTPPEKLEQFYRDAEARYEKEIPPGFKDKKKPVPRRYGDYVIWRQIIEFANEKKKPIIFVTDDAKEDWWQEFKGLTIGPRPELRREILTEGGVPFYMYQGDAFIDWALDMFKLAKDEEKMQAVEEAKAVRESQARDEALATTGLANRMETVYNNGRVNDLCTALGPVVVADSVDGNRTTLNVFEGGVVHDVTVRGRSLLNLAGGLAGNIDTYDTSAVTITGKPGLRLKGDLSSHDSSSLVLGPGAPLYLSQIFAYDSSTAIVIGAEMSSVYTYGRTNVTLRFIALHYELETHDNSVVEIDFNCFSRHGGRRIKALGQSRVNLHAKNFAGDKPPLYIVASGSSIVTIFCNLSSHRGAITERSGTVVCRQSDGAAGNIEFSREGDSAIVINSEGTSPD